MHHIFISYARSDAPLVTPIAECIERAGMSTWIDHRDIPISLPWFDEVRYAIEGADIVLACSSPASRKSEACQLELMIARQQGKQVFSTDLDQIQEPTAVTRNVLAARNALDSADRLRTELLVRSADWQQAGHPSSRLQSGRTLRHMRRLARSPVQPLPPVAREFLEISHRRALRRRILSSLGASVLLIALLSYNGIRDAQKGFEHQDASATAGYVRSTFSEYALQEDVYAAIRNAIPGVASAPEGYTWRAQLMAALSTPVPDQSSVIRRDALRGFAAPVVDGYPAFSKRPTSNPHVARGHDQEGELEARASIDSGIVTVLRRPAESVYRRLSVGGPARALAFSPDGRVVAAAVEDQVRLFDLQIGVVRATLGGSRGTIHALAWSRDGARIWAITGTHRVSSWRWRFGKVLIDDPRIWFVAVTAPDRDGQMALIARDGSVRLLDPEKHVFLHTIRTDVSPVLNGVLDSAGRLLVLGTTDALALVSLPSGTVRTISLPGCTVTSVGIAPDARTAYAACVNGSLESVDTAAGRYERSVAIPMGGALSVAVASVSGTIFVGTVFGAVLELQPPELTPRIIQRMGDPVPIWAVAVTPDGRTVRTIGDGTSHLEDALEGHRSADGGWSWFRLLYPGIASDQGRALAFSPDGVLAASGLGDGTVKLDTTANLTPEWTWTEMTGQIRALAFTADGRGLIAATRTGLAELLPACPSCRPARAIVEVARSRLTQARKLGLTDQ